MRRYLRAAGEALRSSDATLALQLAAKIPEEAPEFTEAQDIETRALLSMWAYVEDIDDQAKMLVEQVAQVRISEEKLRAELSKAIPGSQRYAQLSQGLKELDAEEQELSKSNKLLAAGYGALTDKGRERALEIAYETALGHPIDPAGKRLAERIAREGNFEVAARGRRDYAARFQVMGIKNGSSINYSTSGTFDTTLILVSYSFSDTGVLRRVSRALRQGEQALCDEGFAEVDYRLPGVSRPELVVTLDCNKDKK